MIIIVSASGDKTDSDDNMIGPAMPPKHSTKAGTIGKENYFVLYSRPTCVTVLVIKFEISCFIFIVLVSKSRSSVHLKLNTSLFLLSNMDQFQIDPNYVLFDISAGPSLSRGAVSSDDEDAYCPPLPPGLPAAPTAPAAVTAHQPHQDNQAHGE